jgi:hypothetical protein
LSWAAARVENKASNETKVAANFERRKMVTGGLQELWQRFAGLGVACAAKAALVKEFSQG